MRLTRSFVARCGMLALSIVILFAATAFAQSEYVVFSFPATGSQGRAPEGNLVADAAGNLYGTTYGGGAASDTGTVFELVRPVPPLKQWTHKLLYSFTGGLDGAYPTAAGVIFDASGNLYGTTYSGGLFGYGVIFRVAPPTTAGGEWTETVIYSFQGQSNDGAHPESGLIFDRAGNLFGTTTEGGFDKTLSCRGGCGTVFQLSPPTTAGGSWSETVIHRFNNLNGTFPLSAPIIDAHGNLYGTTQGGGLHGKGVVYRLTPPNTAGEAWDSRTLYAFGANNNDSAYPAGGLTLHGAGLLYGTTILGGIYNDGTVFQLVPPPVAGGAWTENVLLAFSGMDGSSPVATMIFDKAGNLYGTAPDGGKAGCDNFGCGTVFRLSPPASPGANWTETVLHSFPTSRIDGLTPSGGLMLSKNGVLFGVTQDSMNTHAGAVYGIVP
jgi:uncharacterized repeat protein (TIGR03803 family)